MRQPKKQTMKLRIVESVCLIEVFLHVLAVGTRGQRRCVSAELMLLTSYTAAWEACKYKGLTYDMWRSL